MHGLNYTKYRGITPKNGSVTFNPQDLEIPLNEVARCAGGSRYQMDSKIKELAQSMFNQALSLVRPAYGYTASDVINAVPDKGFAIGNNILIPCPLDIQSETISIISLICTIGADLELKVHELNTKCMQLEALFLDASGVALLEATAQQAYVKICKQAIKAGIKRPKRILLAGAFGNYLDLEDCNTIGLLADVRSQDIKVVGNAAGAGAVLTMYNETSEKELRKLAQLAKVFNLSADSEFQHIFVKNLNFHGIAS